MKNIFFIKVKKLKQFLFDGWLIKIKSIGLGLILCFSPIALEAQESSVISSSESLKYRNFHNFAIGSQFVLLGNDVGSGLSLITPHFYKNRLAVYFEAMGFVVDSKIRKTSKSIDHIYYQYYGLLRLGFQISSATYKNIRLYSKIGGSMVLLRDKTWDDYYHSLYGSTREHDSVTDFFWGVTSLAGFELIVLEQDSFYLEAGMELFIGNTVNPNTKLEQKIYETVGQKMDIMELNFIFALGYKYYFTSS